MVEIEKELKFCKAKIYPDLFEDCQKITPEEEIVDLKDVAFLLVD